MVRASKRRSSAKSEAAASTDWNKKTVAELKKECASRGLEETGKKAALVQRIQDDENGTSNGPPAKLQKKNTLQTALEVMKTSAKKDNKKKTHKVDTYVTVSSVEVHADYDCMLNQTNIGNNNNKYYVIQVLKAGPTSYYTWNRWGRVGEPGAHKMTRFSTAENAITDFMKKFHDKTKNDWDKRKNFKAVKGKYTLLDMGDDEDEPVPMKAVALSPAKGGLFQKTKPLSLDKATAAFVQLIFDLDMFKEALISLEIDIKKMPLGKLSKPQIVKGFEVLDKINTILDSNKKAGLTELSNEFYTLIPHDFGRQRPAVIQDKDHLRKKMDLLLTLGDIEMAQDMLKNQNQSIAIKGDEDPPHPLDVQYEMLNCKLGYLNNKDKEYGIIETYLKSTGGYRVKKIINVWKMDRVPEGSRFKEHAKVDNRKLLWHGTNLAVVAAILKSGLRIMPHSGGRVGRGIYFASENSKSAGYVGTVKKTGVMFLNEVVLGKEHFIQKDDCSLTKAPNGFQSVVAKGRTEPDEKNEVSLVLDGKKVLVPQGKPVPQSKYNQSGFMQSEYLVYKESQVRMRYCLQLEFDH